MEKTEKTTEKTMVEATNELNGFCNELQRLNSEYNVLFSIDYEFYIVDVSVESAATRVVRNESRVRVEFSGYPDQVLTSIKKFAKMFLNTAEDFAGQE